VNYAVGPVSGDPKGDENPLPSAIDLATWPTSNPNGRLLFAGLGADRATRYTRNIRRAKAQPVMKIGEHMIRFRWDFIMNISLFACMERIAVYLRDQVYEFTPHCAIGGRPF